jgi:carbonic anhydrase
MKKLNILIIIELFYSIFSTDINVWRDYPACKLGRLQSPIEINENESIYANNFSFVYQNYKEIKMPNKTDNYNYSTVFEIEKSDGFINFERGGVIKQYEFIRAELYPGLHAIDGVKGASELHLIHKKNLDFVTNKNQYRSIQDPNMYLVVVLRYKNCNVGKESCTFDNGLLEHINSEISNTNIDINLNQLNIFQDKRAYFYEGSFVHIPCDENVNYYIVKDFFHFKGDLPDFTDKINNVNLANIFGRPVYKNFMNYREVLGNHYFSFKNVVVSFLFIIILL